MSAQHMAALDYLFLRRTTEVNDHYAAGLIDGEGYIGIQQAGGTHQLRLKVSMSDKGLPALRALKSLYGGKIYDDREVTETRRATSTWVLTGDRAGEVIERLSPLFLVKRQAADVALEFRKLHQSLEPSPLRGRRWTQEASDRAAMLVRRIQEANRRGPDPDPPNLPAGVEPLAIYRWGWWWEPNDSLFGPVEFEGKLPTSGMMISGHVYEAKPPQMT